MRTRRIIIVRENDKGDLAMGEDNVKCPKCGSSFNRMYLIGKQGNADVCPVCGADMEIQSVDEHPDWITWWYYGFKDKDGKQMSGGGYLSDKQVDLSQTNMYVIKEFQAPPRDANGKSDKAKEILRTYVPDAFASTQDTVPEVRCPRCGSKEIQLVPRKCSLLTGFATNKFDRMCVYCKKKF